MAPPEDMNAFSDANFRAAVRSFVEREYPRDQRFQMRRLRWREYRPWFLALSARGWAAPGWPREYGGMGLSAVKQLIMIEEFERYGCARGPEVGIVMLGPLLIRHGSPAQKQFFLPKILSGEHVWCQGYSEPGAGSDLAALSTAAELDGDEWVINGQKIWSTLAQDANWAFLLARTARTGKKQEGISFLLAPMDRPGITVRPIKNIDLYEEFCEIFFDNVRIPRANLVGEVNKGWSVAKAQLGMERLHIGSPRLASYAMSCLERAARRAGLWDDDRFRDRMTACEFELADHKALYEVYAGKMKRGEPLNADVSMLKLNQSELFQRMADLMLEVVGNEAALLDPPEGERALHAAALSLLSRSTTIFGGTSEIQRNVIARDVLALPSA